MEESVLKEMMQRKPEEVEGPVNLPLRLCRRRYGEIC